MSVVSQLEDLYNLYLSVFFLFIQAEELFQVDEQNQGNTLLSVAPLPPQEPVEKLTRNGESLDSPPTNGHSATQTPVADSEM